MAKLLGKGQSSFEGLLYKPDDGFFFAISVQRKRLPMLKSTLVNANEFSVKKAV